MIKKGSGFDPLAIGFTLALLTLSSRGIVMVLELVSSWKLIITKTSAVERYGKRVSYYIK